MQETVPKDNLGNDLVESRPPQNSFMTVNDLPNEVLVQIFAKLELTQLNNLRLVCKNWNRIVSDNTVWEKSFKRKFGNNDIFPSFAGTQNWIVEYLSRLSNLKKWRKAPTSHMTYQILNEVYVGDNIYNISSFRSDRFLAYSQINNHVTLCTLHNGRNQTYIPGNVNTVSAFAVNWNYLTYGTKEAGLFVRNLVTSTSSASSRLSVKEFKDPEHVEISTAICMNKDIDKHRIKPDIITGTASGRVTLWNMNGDVVSRVAVDGHIVKMVTDFKQTIVVCCQTKLAFIDFKTLEVRELATADIDPELFLDDETIVDVDLVGRNVVLCFHHKLRVVQFESAFAVRRADLDFPVKFGKMQRPTARESVDRDLVGKDGLFYGNVLEDDSIIVWNIREDTPEIVPINRFTSQFKYKSLTTIVGADQQVNSLELNSSIVVVGGFNGFCNIHDIFSGKYLRECSTKYPKKYVQMHVIPTPVREIHLNENATYTSGITICGGLIQHFQFGERPEKKEDKKKVSVVGAGSKHTTKKLIQDQLDDYDSEQYKESQLHSMLDKYNGRKYDSDEEVSIALAMSRSTQPDELEQAIQRSMVDPEDEALALALEMSLIDQ